MVPNKCVFQFQMPLPFCVWWNPCFSCTALKRRRKICTAISKYCFSQSSAGGYPTNIEAREIHIWHGKFPFDRFFVFYRWRRQSAHKAKNLKNAAAFNRINTIVEMFSSGYINSTDISCRPTSIGRLWGRSKMYFAKPGGNKNFI